MLILIAFLVLGAPPAVHEFEFDGPDDGRRYAARLTVPAEHTGAAVLLTGGGTAFDEHWTTPGSMESEGHAIQLTIDGKDTRDADLLAAALAERGLIVMQWSLVHSGDALRDGMLGDPLTYVQGMPVARAALAALRARPEVNPDRIILLGHSLGATRSFQMCDDGVIGVASLAGAYLDRSLVAPRKTAEDVWASFAGADTDGDNALSASEFAATGAPAARLGVTFDGVDRDRDGTARPWELAASDWTHRIGAGDDPRDARAEFRPGLPWPVDVMAERTSLKCLLVAGGLDELSFHAALVQGRNLPNVEVVYHPGVGHLLGEERDHRVGPMDESIIARVAEWSAALAATTPEAPAEPATTPATAIR